MYRVLLVCALAIPLTACQNAPAATAQPTSLAQQSASMSQGADLAAEFAKIRPSLVQAVSSRGGGNGALFIQTTMLNGIFMFDGQQICGVSQENRGNGSFYRQNPDGTVTAKLSDAAASLFYSPDFFTTTYSGTGSFQFHATGAPLMFDFGGGFIVVMVNPPYRGHYVANGGGRVVPDGTAGPSALLRCSVMLNPDGSFKKYDITLR